MKVFISHSGADEKWADALRVRLAQEGMDVLNPGAEFVPGDNWGLTIGKALEACDAMVVLLSPDASKSDWVQHEIDYALTSPRFQGRLVSVLVRPTAEVPWILKKQPFIRASKDPDQTAQQVAAAFKKSEPALQG